jgi:hypothetical protein
MAGEKGISYLMRLAQYATVAVAESSSRATA